MSMAAALPSISEEASACDSSSPATRTTDSSLPPTPPCTRPSARARTAACSAESEGRQEGFQHSPSITLSTQKDRQRPFQVQERCPQDHQPLRLHRIHDRRLRQASNSQPGDDGLLDRFGLIELEHHPALWQRGKRLLAERARG